MGWELIAEINGERRAYNVVSGQPDRASDSHTVYVSPGVRLLGSGWSAAASFGLPVYQKDQPGHSEENWRALVSVGQCF